MGSHRERLRVMRLVGVLAGVLVSAAAATMLLAQPAAAFVSAGADGWVWQNPLPQGNDLYSVSFVDSTRGWAVGDSGTVVVTEDGETWASQASGTDIDLAGVDFIDADHGWAVGQGGVIIATVDGGDHWWPQSSGTLRALTSVDFSDVSHGCAVGGFGTILVTSDGGLTWSPRTCSPAHSLRSVSFADAEHGLAVGDCDLVYRTADGGSSWTAVSTGDGGMLPSVDFVDGVHGWAVSSRGRVLSTADGGASWSSRQLGGYVLNVVSFADAGHGWVASGGSYIFATSDGGATWSSQTSATTAEVNGMCFTDASHGFGVGAAGTTLSTSDGGARWSLPTGRPDDTLDFADACFVDAAHGWLVGEDFSTFGFVYTSDGGASWHSQAWWGNDYPNGVSFCDREHGWVVGNDGLVMRTRDGGATWEVQNAGTRKDMLEVACADERHAWVVCEDHSVLGTGDGGVTWSTQLTRWENLVGIACADKDHCWVAAGATIFATSDGGASWVKQDPGSDVHVSSVDFVDAKHGWAGTSSGTILKTDDGGASWHAQSLGIEDTSVGTADIAFADLDHGWAVSSHLIFKTEDGGATWSVEDAATESTLRCVAAVDARRAWVAGRGGIILRYGLPWVVISGADDVWHGGAIDLTVHADVRQGCTLQRLDYSLDGGSTWTPVPGSGGARTLKVVEDGEHIVRVRAEDSRGEVSTDSAAVRVEASAPSVAISGCADAWRRKPAQLMLTPSTGPSGVRVVEYKVGAGEWTALEPTEGAYLLTVSEEGVNTVSARVTSGAGVTGAATSCVLRIDTAKPRVRARNAAVRKGGSCVLGLYLIKDPVGCGAARVKVAIYKGSKKVGSFATRYLPVNAWVHPKVPKARTARLAKGRYVMKLRAIDELGNAQSGWSRARLLVWVK